VAKIVAAVEVAYLVSTDDLREISKTFYFRIVGAHFMDEIRRHSK